MKNNWSDEELIVAFNLYCKLGFKKIKYTHPEIVSLGNIIDRTPSAVAYKLVNFARLDPELQSRGVKGMSHGSKAEIRIWEEFNNDWEKLAFKSEVLLAKYKHVPVESLIDLNTDQTRQGFDREAQVRVRVNQSFFRRTVLESYNNQCCITGISVPRLLVASHIIPWSVDHKNRINPHNGVCLNALHDRAFDKGLITITPDFKIKVSEVLLRSNNNTALEFLTSFHGKEVAKPHRFIPIPVFLRYHNETIFKP